MKPNQIIADTYRVVDKIGQGGMSEVYAATHEKLQRKTAIKVLSANLLHDQRSRERFQHEGKVVCRLSHPNIATVYDCGVMADGSPYLVMDFVDGTTLSDLIGEEGKPVVADRTLRIIEQICKGLSYAHSQGILHRDIKPSNVMISHDAHGDELAVILDFGLAKLITEEGSGAHLTMTGETVGTPSYMSPEQCLGKPVDARSDIYSLGCVMYEALTGKKPFDAENAILMIGKHLKERPPAFSVVLPGLKNMPPWCEDLVFRMLEKDPADRPQSVEEVLNEVRALRKATTPMVAVQKWSGRVGRRFKQRTRSPLFSIAIGVMLLGLCIGAIVAWQTFRHEPVVFKFANIPPTTALLSQMDRGTLESGFLRHDYVDIAFLGNTMMKNIQYCPGTISDIESILKVASVYADIGRYDDARFLADKAEGFSKKLGNEAVGQGIRARLLTAQCMAATGYGQAEANAKEAADDAKRVYGDHHETYADALTDLGIVELKMKKPADAANDFIAASQIMSRFVSDKDPSIIRQKTLLAKALMDQNKFSDAKVIVDELTTTASTGTEVEPAEKSTNLALMARVEVGLGNDDKAMGLYEQAIREQSRVQTVYPGFSKLLREYADLLKRHGFSHEADANLQQAQMVDKALGLVQKKT